LVQRRDDARNRYSEGQKVIIMILGSWGHGNTGEQGAEGSFTAPGFDERGERTQENMITASES
jgi:hypothetical protein